MREYLVVARYKTRSGYSKWTIAYDSTGEYLPTLVGEEFAKSKCEDYQKMMQEEFPDAQFCIVPVELPDTSPNIILTPAAPYPRTCILTGAEGENPDDCTTHEHRRTITRKL